MFLITCISVTSLKYDNLKLRLPCHQWTSYEKNSIQSGLCLAEPSCFLHVECGLEPGTCWELNTQFEIKKDREWVIRMLQGKVQPDDLKCQVRDTLYNIHASQLHRWHHTSQNTPNNWVTGGACLISLNVKLWVSSVKQILIVYNTTNLNITV